MALALVYSRAVTGIVAPLVTVEVHLSNGMAGFHMVGLPEAAVKESKDRVRSALMNTHFEFPIKHITVNLAPADLPKEGGRFDLAIALGILAASKQIPMEILNHYEFTGELALSGALRPVRGVLPMVLAAHQAKRVLIAPKQNGQEAALAQQASVFSAEHLLEVCAFLRGENNLIEEKCDSFLMSPGNMPDLVDVKAQHHAKRALEIAAAGSHSLLLIGPPGTGKTMLALRLPGLLPALNEQQALEVAAIASMSQQGFQVTQWKAVPYRAPHHTASQAALVGGGKPIKPGEVSLAHHGVLFLDELPEFKRPVLECLREPLEAGSVTISRVGVQAEYPAKFQLIAAMNPCPCGYAGSTVQECVCSVEQIRRYHNRLSGPLLDRIDMQVSVPQLSAHDLAVSSQQQETTQQFRDRILLARAYQQKRGQAVCNVHLSAAELERMACLDLSARNLLLKLLEKYHFSARVYQRLVKLARTIADLEQRECIDERHISEAFQFRRSY